MWKETSEMETVVNLVGAFPNTVMTPQIEHAGCLTSGTQKESLRGLTTSFKFAHLHGAKGRTSASSTLAGRPHLGYGEGVIVDRL